MVANECRFQIKRRCEAAQRYRLTRGGNALLQCRSERVVESADERSGTWQAHTGNPFLPQSELSGLGTL